jgi:prolipoprotein diacylglyceryltransferase
VPVSVVFFQFDPFAHLPGDLTVRWAVIALVAVIIASLVLAGILARAGGVRPDDVAFVAVGIVPGAVIGGRLGYFLIHNAYYGSAPGRLLDPSIGGMDLGLAVVGGFLTGCYVASLLGAPLGRWLHLAAAPVLFALGAGKLTMVLAGSGQGVPTVTDPATAYLGPGPWGSLLPALPSVPSQALEGAATLAILAVLTVILIVGAFRSRDGRLFYFAIGLWAVARALVSTTWRDAVVTDGLNGAGLISVGIAVGCVVAVVALTIRNRGRAPDADRVDPMGPTEQRTDIAWPDPETRSRF